MNWIKENKFLTVFFGVMLAGASALGYLLLSSKANFDEVQANYNTASTELSRLQALSPYPNESNLKAMQAQKSEYVGSSIRLQESLAALQFPLEPIHPEEYQDQLRKTVDEAVAKAGPGVLPAKFYLGFDSYQSSPPTGDAAAPLSRELKAIEWVVNALLDAKVHSISDIRRVPIVEETAEAKAAAKTGKPLKVTSDGGVHKSNFEITFTAEQGRVRSALNAIVNSKKQFYIIRSLIIKNEKEKGPLRATASVPGVNGPASQGVAPSDSSQKLQVIAGNEKLIVTARIEIVDFSVQK